MRILSSEIFRANHDGSYTIIRPIKLGGATLSNVTFNGDVKIAGVNLTDLVNKQLEVEDSGTDVLVIKGYYN